MKLRILDRIVLLGMLQNDIQGNMATLRSLNKLEKQLPLTVKEVKKSGFTVNEKQQAWKKDVEVDIKIEKAAKEEIVKLLETLEKEKRLSKNHMGTYEKFVETN